MAHGNILQNEPKKLECQSKSGCATSLSLMSRTYQSRQMLSRPVHARIGYIDGVIRLSEHQQSTDVFMNENRDLPEKFAVGLDEEQRTDHERC
jgi:hypothetical protein